MEESCGWSSQSQSRSSLFGTCDWGPVLSLLTLGSYVAQHAVRSAPVAPSPNVSNQLQELEERLETHDPEQAPKCGDR